MIQPIPHPDIVPISPRQLARRLRGALAPRLVDVREAEELAGELGHIEGVDHVPLAALGVTSAAWSRDDEVVLICRSGGRSTLAAQFLLGQGFMRVLNLDGGMLAWNAASLPVRRGRS